MENFNKNSLKAAVGKYGSLYADGKAEAEVKEALLADEKSYTQEQVDEIYSAITFVPEEKVIAGYKVLNPFRDKNDFSIEYNEDSDISHLEKDRIDHLLNIGYIQPLEAE